MTRRTTMPSSPSEADCGTTTFVKTLVIRDDRTVILALHKRLKLQALENGRSLSAELVEAIRHHFETTPASAEAGQ